MVVKLIRDLSSQCVFTCAGCWREARPPARSDLMNGFLTAAISPLQRLIQSQELFTRRHDESPGLLLFHLLQQMPQIHTGCPQASAPGPWLMGHRNARTAPARDLPAFFCLIKSKYLCAVQIAGLSLMPGGSVLTAHGL